MSYVLGTKPAPKSSSPSPGMVSCKFCGRHFLKERLLKHETVCKKLSTKKRKIFDSSTHRVMGTDAEIYYRHLLFQAARNSGKKNYSSMASAAGAAMAPKKNNWKQKHDELMAIIRNARISSNSSDNDGKTNDNEPPKPMPNPDYIQCPHCGRRFNQGAAERHIPICANMLHNKPKPGSKGPQKSKQPCKVTPTNKKR